MTKQGDELVSEYLSKVQAAAVRLDSRQREELMRDLREHIDTARRELPSESEVEIRRVLDRLGDPFDIVEAAGDEQERRVLTADSPAKSQSGRYKKAAVIVGGAILIAAIIAILFLAFFAGGNSPTSPVPAVT